MNDKWKAIAMRESGGETNDTKNCCFVNMNVRKDYVLFDEQMKMKGKIT